MQTFNLDLTVKSIVPRLLAKQGDVGRRFLAVITDNGTAYQIPQDAELSIWYCGAGGAGNYSVIGDKSAFAVDGNTVTVELITQMLNNYGEGNLCLVINRQDGTQIGTWNIPYVVEQLPGMDSQIAQQHFSLLDIANNALESAGEKVSYTEQQNLTGRQKEQARRNIGMVSDEWTTIIDTELTQAVNKFFIVFSTFGAGEYKRVMLQVILPGELENKSFYAFYTDNMWNGLFGYTVSSGERKILLDFEIIDGLGITLQINGNPDNYSVANTASGKILRESTQTTLDRIGIANGTDGLFPVGTAIRIWGRKV